MWYYIYDDDSEETTIGWERRGEEGEEEEITIDGRITHWKNGYPASEDAREAIAEIIQEAGTPKHIRMQFDFNYGFSKRSDDNS